MPAQTAKTQKSSKEETVKKREVIPPAMQESLAPESTLPTMNLQRAVADPRTARPPEILALQRKYGNDAVQRLLVNHNLQAKLTVGAANDSYEQEADRVAAQVMSAPAHAPDVQRQDEEEEIQTKPLAATITPLIQRQRIPEEEEEEPLQGKFIQRQTKEEEEELLQGKFIQRQAIPEEEELQTKSIPGGEIFSPGANFESRLAATRGGGRPLPKTTRDFMEQRFGADFSSVRLHTGSESARLNREVSAQAFTRGQDIYLGEGKENVECDAGKQLLAHELTHTIQQGAASAQQQTIISQFHRPVAALQRKIGFELELKTLVDINGRPPPEKSFLGRYGTQGLELQVDHNGEVEGPAPTAARDANFQAARRLPTLANPDPRWRQFGAYDLPQGWETTPEVSVIPRGGAVADPRAALNFDLLRPATWQARTHRNRFRRPPLVSDVGLNNAALVNIDAEIPQYEREKKDWEAHHAAQRLTNIRAQAQAWLAANNNPPAGIGNWRRRNRYQAARALIQALDARAQQHHVFWTNPANQDPPRGLGRLYRESPTAAHPNPAWRTNHPVAGAGGPRYASILEIVTRPYEPETDQGKSDLIDAMTQANQLAGEIEARTGNFANRVPFNWAGVNLLNPNTYIGNAGPTNSPQSTDASIQSTFAVDLSQIGSLMKSTVAFGAPQQQLSLKHQGDVAPSAAHLGGINRAEVEMSRAVTDATNIIHDLKAAIGAHPPAFVNLRGLLILVCQYLRMGKYWKEAAGDQSLDKNLTDLLSRTDLSSIYMNLVPAAEKAWLSAAPANMNSLYGWIFNRTGRTRASLLLNTPAENLAPGGGHQFAITCDQFVQNVFSQAADGVTGHWGGFQQRPAESIDPFDSRPGAEAGRQAPVFEMRNMIPKLGGAERFPRATWVPLATYMADLMSRLNARTEAEATRDVRLNADATAVARTEGAW